MENIIKTIPQVGDIVVLIDGKKRFIDGVKATKSFIDTMQAIGVVYDVQGKLVRIVGGVNGFTQRWSAVADYEITAIPSASGDYEVKLNNAVKGNFTYTKSAGTIEEFATQLNTWLSTNAPKWEAYTRNGHSYLQQSTYDEYESTCSIASTTIVKLIGNEVADYTSSVGLRNQIGLRYTYCGMNRNRIESYCKTNTSGNCNPTTEMNGTTQLYVTYPCSEAYYNGELGGGLRSHFSTYGKYLDACMAILEELNKGCLQFRDGKLMTSLLKDKTVLVRGEETYAHTAARWAYDYDSGVFGFGPGKWWLPSMYELGKLMRTIGVGENKIVQALGKKTGWSVIGNSSSRRSSCRYSSDLAWTYNNAGISYRNYFHSSIYVSAVSAFELDE